MTDQWTFWRATLAGDKPEPPTYPGEAQGLWDVTAESLQSGYYRSGNVPIAIWRDEAGALHLRRDGMPTKAASICSIWPRLYRDAVTKEDYDRAVQDGVWPDSPPPRDHNLPTDPFERAKAMIDAEAEQAVAFLATPISDQVAADKAAAWATRVGELAKEADAMRAAEKKPHDEAGKAVQAKWTPIVSKAETTKRDLKRHVEPWLLKLQREEAERRAAAATQGQAPEPVRNAAAGRTGSKVALRTVTRAEITDLPALAAYIAAFKEPNPDFVDVCQRLALRMLTAGVDVPGARKITTQQAA